MADSPLKVSRPVTPNDTVGKLRPAREQALPDISDPSRISSKNTTEQAGADEGYSFQFDRSSVLSRFASLVENTPGLAETLEKAAFGAFLFPLEQAGEGLAQSPLAQLAQAMRMTPEEMVHALKYQQEAQTKFNGMLFDLLRGLAAQTKDPQLPGIIARFLKAFDGNTSQEQTTGQILRNLKDILRGLPASYRQTLEAMVNRLNGDQSTQAVLKQETLPFLESEQPTLQQKAEYLKARLMPLLEAADDGTRGLRELKEDLFYLLQGMDTQSGGAMERRLDILKNEIQNFLRTAPEAPPPDPQETAQNNLNILKNEIVPFLSNYVSNTNDFSQVRNTIALLVHNIARLNISSRAELETSFEELTGYLRFNLGLPADKAGAMRTLMEEALKSGGQQEEKFFSALCRYLSDPAQAGTSAVKDLISSLLLDQSVFSPYTHLFLPVNFQGKFLFTELWIARDQEEEKTAASAEAPPMRLFLSFDVQDLGYFDATLLVNGNRCALELNCPEKLRAKDGEIRDGVAKILAQNGFSPEEIRLTRGKEPKNPREALNIPQDRRSFIHVTV